MEKYLKVLFSIWEQKKNQIGSSKVGEEYGNDPKKMCKMQIAQQKTISSTLWYIKKISTQKYWP